MIEFFKQANTGTPVFGSSGDLVNPPIDNTWNDWMKSEFDSTNPLPLITGNPFVFGGGNFGYIVKLDRSKPRANSNGKWVIRDERRSGLSGITLQQRFFLRASYYFPSSQFQFANDSREYIVLYQHGVSTANPRLYIRVTHDGQFYIQLEEVSEGITYRHYVGPATLDVLHTFVIEVNWGSGSDGYVNVWKDTPTDYAPMYNSSGVLSVISAGANFSFLKRPEDTFSRFNREGKNMSVGTVLAQRFNQMGAYVPNPELPWNSTNPFSGEEPYDPNNLTTLPTYREFYMSGLAWLIPEPSWERQDIVDFMFGIIPSGEYTLTLTTTAGGTAISNILPDENGDIIITQGGTVILTATQSSGFNFSRWQNVLTGQVLSTSTTYNHVMTSDISIVAVFVSDVPVDPSDVIRFCRIDEPIV